MTGHGPSFGRVTIGLLFLMVGGLWLARALDVLDLPLAALGPVALLILGGALLIGSRSASHGGLVALGALLAVVLVAQAAVFPRAEPGAVVVEQAVGERYERPRTEAALSESYEVGVGELTLDLGSLRVTREHVVRVRVGVGTLEVILPRDTTSAGRARAGAGRVRALGSVEGGFRVDVDFSTGGPRAGRLLLDASVGVGRVIVHLTSRDAPPAAPPPDSIPELRIPGGRA